jgi:6-phosphofructokinase 1
VKNIHKQGGTILGSSRGGFDKDKILDALEEKGIN